MLNHAKIEIIMGELDEEIAVAKLYLSGDGSKTKLGITRARRKLNAFANLVFLVQMLKDKKLVECPSEEEIEKILEDKITHIEMYHDKECGRITKEQIIFKQRFSEVSHAIVEKMKGE